MNRRTFLGIIPAAAGISRLAASPAPAPAKWPLVIPVVESLEEAPPSGPAILVSGSRDDCTSLELFVPMLDRKVIWIVASETLGPLEAFFSHVSAHQVLNVYLRGEAPKTWIWAATRDEAVAEAGRVLGLDPAERTIRAPVE